ncbi:alpha/beta hydrolase [Roseateles sp. NT4]|uniref:alpha/beta hydrolase n=1 Tax=Roseateles sp. NT4 TaxID=3453715 RepID=UPI003EED171C
MLACVSLLLALAEPVSAPAYVYAGTVEADQRIASKITGITYPYHVYLPAGYASSGRRYPVMVATDGQWSFGSFSRMLDQHRKAMILVSVEQGGPEPDRRAVDYTVEGAPAYARFLREELVPLVESSYRTTAARSFAGTSYGAVLGAVMLSTEDVARPFFSNYLLFDGSFWALKDKNIRDEDARFAASHRLRVHLILTSADAPGNVEDVTAYEARYKARAWVGLRIDRKDFNVAHDKVGKPSFDWAIDLID